MKQTKQTTILMSGGGTGGHLVPLLTLARELKRQKPGYRLVYIGHRGEKFKIDHELFDSIYQIRAGKLRRWPYGAKTIVLNLRDVLLTISGFFQALRLIGREKPDVLFSKGSFVAVPAILAARLMGIPIVTHDSDSIAGLANRLAGNGAAFHATGFPEDLYNYPAKKTKYLGVPLKQEIFKPKEKISHLKTALGVDSRSRVLLVIGGSIGAASLNKKLPAIAAHLVDKIQSLAIVHITGERYLEDVTPAYPQSLIKNGRVQVHSYTEKLVDFMRIADLVVSRAGATTMAELAALAKPCLIIASPYLSGGHQLKNAQWYEARQSIVTLPDSISEAELAGKINSTLSSPTELKRLSIAISKLAKPFATQELVELIINTAESHHA